MPDENNDETVLPEDVELLQKINFYQELIIGLVMIAIYAVICSFVTVLINANNTLLAVIIIVPYLVFLGWMYFLGTKEKNQTILIASGVSGAGIFVLLILLLYGFI